MMKVDEFVRFFLFFLVLESCDPISSEISRPVLFNELTCNCKYELTCVTLNPKMSVIEGLSASFVRANDKYIEPVYYNQHDTLVLDFGKSTLFKNHLQIDVVNGKAILKYNPFLEGDHDIFCNPFEIEDNVKTFNIEIDSTKQVYKVKIDLEYAMDVCIDGKIFEGTVNVHDCCFVNLLE